MRPNFHELIEGLPNKFDALMAMEPVRLVDYPNSRPPLAPNSGIYLFSNEVEHHYVGRNIVAAPALGAG